MEKSTLYDILSSGVLQKWRGEEEEQPNIFTKYEKEALEELSCELNEKSKGLLTSYAWALENKMDFIYFNICKKFLNLGIKIGMELEEAFSEMEEN